MTTPKRFHAATPPITDLEISAFKQMHVCPSTHQGGGCQRCAMVTRIESESAKTVEAQRLVAMAQRQVQQLEARLSGLIVSAASSTRVRA